MSLSHLLMQVILDLGKIPYLFDNRLLATAHAQPLWLATQSMMGSSGLHNHLIPHA